MKLSWKQVVPAFLLGAAAGLLLSRCCAISAFHRHGSGRFEHYLLDQFSSKLQLTEEQRGKVAAILEAKRKKVDALRAEIKPRFEEIRTSTSGEIRQLLNPDQQKKFDQLEAKWSIRRKRFHDRWAGQEGNS